MAGDAIAHLVFSGSATGGSVLQPLSVAASGRSPARPAFGVPGRFIVYDVARDGRWLAVREDLSFGVRAKVPSQEAERDLSWMGSAGARGLSADGEWLLMIDVGCVAAGLRRRPAQDRASQTIRSRRGQRPEALTRRKWASGLIAAPAHW
jgi:hypothetical protein